MQEEIRFATFNVCNLAPAGAKLYDNLEPLSPAQYAAKAEWTARQIDLLDADVIGFQEIFSQAALRDVLSRTRHYRAAALAGHDAMDAAGRMLPTVALVSRLPLAGAGVAWTNFPAGVSVSAEDNTYILSPNTKQALSFPINDSPMIKACANPSGLGCSAYSNCTPYSLPSPNNRRKPGRSCGVEIISISRIPASINTEIG